MLQNYRRYRFVHSFSFLLLLMAFQLLFFPVAVQAVSNAQSQDATAVVVVAALNVRSGPGTNYAKVGLTKSGETLTVMGQTGNCAWLQIRTAQAVEGWVSGSSRYVTLSSSCAEIPSVAVGGASLATNSVPPAAGNPSVPTPTPIATPTSPSNGELPSWLAPGADPGMVAELEQKVPLKQDLACVLFQAFTGPIYITLTQQDGKHIEEISLEKISEKVICLPGGKYTVTITSAKGGTAGGLIRFYNGTRDDFRVYRR